MALVRNAVIDCKTGEQRVEWVERDPSLDVEAAARAQKLDAERSNEASIRTALEAALTTNTSDANAADAWVTANPGTLTAAVLSAQVRALTTAAAKAARQRNRLIRLALRRLDGVS